MFTNIKQMFNSKAGDQPSLQQPFAHKKVFNVTLPELLKSHVKLSWSVDGDSKYIPVILKKFAFNIERKDIIETVGLFRLAASSKETREYRDRIEKTGDVDFSKLDPSNNAVIWTLMKTFLREIPDSIVPISLFNNLTDSMENINDLIDIVASIPQPNLDCLIFICLFLFRVASYSKSNKMDINNLVIVFAPNLIGCPSSISNGNPDMYLLESTQATNLFKILLENFWTIFDSLIPNLRDLKSIYTDPIKSFNLESYNLEDLSPNKPGRRLNDLPSPTPAETKKFNSIIKSTIQKSLFGKKNKHPEEINEILDIDDHVQNTVPTIPLNASSTGTIRGVHQTLLDELKASFSIHESDVPTSPKLIIADINKASFRKRADASEINLKNKPVETLRIIEDAEEDLFLKPEIKLPERLKSLVAGRPKPPKLQHIEAFKSEPKNIQVKSSAEVISESLQSSPSKAKNVKAQLNISETNIVTEDIQQKTNVIPVNLSPIHSPSKLNIPAKSPRRYMSEQPNHSVVKSQNIDSNPVKSIEEVKSPVKSSEHMSKPITIDSQPLSIRKPVSVQSLMVDTAESRDKSKRILPSADSISTESDTKPMRKQQILEITRPVESRSKLQTVELKPVESPVKQSSISKDEIPQRKYQVVTVESKSENEVKTPSDLKSNLSEVQSLEKRREQSSPISVKSRVVESIPLVDEIDSRGKSKSKSQREYPVEAIELGDSSNTTIRQMFDFTSEYAVPKVVPHYIDTKIEKGDSMLQDVLNTSKKSMIPIPTRANVGEKRKIVIDTVDKVAFGLKLGESTSKYSLPTPLDASITNRVYEGNLKIPDRPFSELSSKEAEAIKTQRKLLHAKVLAYKNTRKDIGAKEYDGDFKADMRLLKDFIVYFSSAYTPTKSPKSIESPLERSLKNVQDFKINGEFIDADKLNESEVKNQMKVLKSEIGELKNFYGVKNGEKYGPADEISIILELQKRYHELKAIRHSRSSSPVTITDLPMVSSPPASPTRSETPNLATPIDLKSRSETSTPNLATSIDLKSRSTKSGTSTLNAVTPIDLKSSSTRSEASTPNLATPIDLKYSPMRAEINNDNTLSGLMARKKHLQKRLTIYQNSFLEQNGRVVETAADRLPCQADYDEYKQVKKQIAKLEGQEG